MTAPRAVVDIWVGGDRLYLPRSAPSSQHPREEEALSTGSPELSVSQFFGETREVFMATRAKKQKEVLRASLCTIGSRMELTSGDGVEKNPPTLSSLIF